jgi:hypothetical protein
MKKLIFTAFLMAMFAVSSLAQVTSLEVWAERMYQVYESPEMWRIYTVAYNGEEQVREHVTISVVQGHRTIRMLGDDYTFWTPLFEPETYNSVLCVERHRGTYTITATATSNGLTGTGEFVIE